MREAIIRTCERLNLNPSWLHRDVCRYGADIGLQHRVHGWLTERGLSLHPLDSHLVDHLNRRYAPWREQRPHPE